MMHTNKAYSKILKKNFVHTFLILRLFKSISKTFSVTHCTLHNTHMNELNDVNLFEWLCGNAP